MRYKELLKPEYFEAFKNYEEKNRKILKEFGMRQKSLILKKRQNTSAGLLTAAGKRPKIPARS